MAAQICQSPPLQQASNGVGGEILGEGVSPPRAPPPLGNFIEGQEHQVFEHTHTHTHAHTHIFFEWVQCWFGASIAALMASHKVEPQFYFPTPDMIGTEPALVLFSKYFYKTYVCFC